MNKNKTLTKVLLFSISLIVIILDRLTKLYVCKILTYGDFITIIPHALSITKVYNTGAAFSILEGQVYFLSLLSILAIIGISYYFIFKAKKLSLYNAICWGLILGGTCGNFIDRFFLKYVIDFIKLDFINFPIFNLADSAINIGVILILISLIKNRKEV